MKQEIQQIKEFCRNNTKKIMLVGAIYLACIDPGASYFMTNSPVKWAKDSYSVVERQVQKAANVWYDVKKP
tara:strand:+ start:746 stop:958 length:213 start_codon:yes stop_codon:yes gene_type:complete